MNFTPALQAVAALLIAVLFLSCQPSKVNEAAPAPNATGAFAAPIQELTDRDYADNPDIFIRHPLDGRFSHREIKLTKDSASGLYNVEMLPGNPQSCTIKLMGIDLLEWMPTIPDHIKKDEYLALIGVVNQEWNREQVSFGPGEFTLEGTGLEADTLSKVDLARNCLNAGLWEIIAFAKQDGKDKPVYHGWFNFPPVLYEQLFEERNNIPFSKYADVLNAWKDPTSQKVDLSVLRKVVSEKPAVFEARNDKMYPIAGDRAKKFASILHPAKPSKISDFLNDSTKFATFSPPGCYRKNEPRSTELSRFAEIEKIAMRQTASNNRDQSSTVEFELFFKKPAAHSKTSMVVGGLHLDKLPALPEKEANSGHHMPMGIANHPFGQPYKALVSNSPKTSPYFAMLLDDRGKWLDSHAIGVDGVVLHLDDQLPNKLHFWLLSFERHALVGHYVIEAR